MMSCVPSNNTPLVELTPSRLVSTPTATSEPVAAKDFIPTTSSARTNSQKLVQQLLENNGGCRLPCWWGITPGKTTWTEAYQILEKVSRSIGGHESGESFYVSVHALLPYPYDFAPYMEQLYSVKNGVVDYICVDNFDLAPKYNLHNFLETYGQPTEVWIRTYSKYEIQVHPFFVYLFYQDKGILVEYNTGDPLKEIDGKLQNCLVKGMDSPFIHLWSPETQNLSFQDARQFIDLKTVPEPEPRPLLEAAGMDIKTFYETFKNPDTNACLETPRELWP